MKIQCIRGHKKYPDKENFRIRCKNCKYSISICICGYTLEKHKRDMGSIVCPINQKGTKYNQWQKNTGQSEFVYYE